MSNKINVDGDILILGPNNAQKEVIVSELFAISVPSKPYCERLVQNDNTSGTRYIWYMDSSRPVGFDDMALKDLAYYASRVVLRDVNIRIDTDFQSTIRLVLYCALGREYNEFDAEFIKSMQSLGSPIVIVLWSDDIQHPNMKETVLAINKEKESEDVPVVELEVEQGDSNLDTNHKSSISNASKESLIAAINSVLS